MTHADIAAMEYDLYYQQEAEQRGRKHDISQREIMLGLTKPSLPENFAGRVLKLEMQIEKGVQFISIDDVNNLMDLYTKAIEYYNSRY